MRPLKFLLLLCLLILPLAPADAEPVTYTTAPLAFKTQGGTLNFTVEESLSDAQHQNGLMFRKSLEDRHGMIFVFTPARRVSFWMKNTLIPLDMIFVDNQGVITQIIENATPESLAPLPSDYDARAVIEVAGGVAAHYHIASGDKVIYSLFP
jgi:uncharacterized membrane protein (UPF0127 family)